MNGPLASHPLKTILAGAALLTVCAPASAARLKWSGTPAYDRATRVVKTPAHHANPLGLGNARAEFPVFSATRVKRGGIVGPVHQDVFQYFVKNVGSQTRALLERYRDRFEAHELEWLEKISRARTLPVLAADSREELKHFSDQEGSPHRLIVIGELKDFGIEAPMHIDPYGPVLLLNEPVFRQMARLPKERASYVGEMGSPDAELTVRLMDAVFHEYAHVFGAKDDADRLPDKFGEKVASIYKENLREIHLGGLKRADAPAIKLFFHTDSADPEAHTKLIYVDGQNVVDLTSELTLQLAYHLRKNVKIKLRDPEIEEEHGSRGRAGGGATIGVEMEYLAEGSTAPERARARIAIGLEAQWRKSGGKLDHYAVLGQPTFHVSFHEAREPAPLGVRFTIESPLVAIRQALPGSRWNEYAKLSLPAGIAVKPGSLRGLFRSDDLGRVGTIHARTIEAPAILAADGVNVKIDFLVPEGAPTDSYYCSELRLMTTDGRELAIPVELIRPLSVVAASSADAPRLVGYGFKDGESYRPDGIQMKRFELDLPPEQESYTLAFQAEGLVDLKKMLVTGRVHFYTKELGTQEAGLVLDPLHPERSPLIKDLRVSRQGSTTSIELELWAAKGWNGYPIQNVLLDTTFLQDSGFREVISDSQFSITHQKIRSNVIHVHQGW